MKFLFRTDATSTVGMGHLMRSLALAEGLKKRHHEVLFATKTDNPALLKRLRDEDFSIHYIEAHLSLSQDATETTRYAQDKQVDWVILDGYGFDTAYQQTIKQAGFKLACLDDIANCHYVSDVILNQNLDAEAMVNYDCEPYTQKLLGSSYILLRTEFADEVGFQRELREKATNVLVTIGGADVENLTLKVVHSIEKITDQKIKLRVILGPSFRHKEEVQAYAHERLMKPDANLNVEVSLYDKELNLVPHMKWCDVAVSAAGSTLWELCFLQTPMIIGIVADNQKFLANQLYQRGACELLGWFRKANENEIAECVKNVLISDSARLSLSQQAALVCDGKGVERVCEVLESDL